MKHKLIFSLVHQQISRGLKLPILAAKNGSNEYLARNPFFNHAVSAPLTNLALHLETLLPQINNKPEFVTEKTLLLQALRETHHLRKLFSGLDQTKPKRMKFFVKPALQEVVLRMNNPLLHQEILSHISLSNTAMLRGHACYFQEAVSCLLKNGFESYPKKNKKPLALIAFQTDKWLTIYVGDQGHGMNWWTRHTIGIQGFSNKKNGNGLGIFFAKQTVEEFFKGKMCIDSDLHSGTVIRIQLPLIP